MIKLEKLGIDEKRYYVLMEQAVDVFEAVDGLRHYDKIYPNQSWYIVFDVRMGLWQVGYIHK